MIRIRNALFALFAVAIATALQAADTREDRNVSGFHAISVGVAMDLDVVQDGTESLTLEGDPEALSKIETSVWNGTLEFTYKRGTQMERHGRVHGVVHARGMDAIALSGAGNVRSPALKADTLTLSTSGSGDVEIGRIDANAAKLSISGSGNMTVAGKADTLNARISGSGAIKAAKLEAQSADVTISGAGTATVWPRQQLAAAISGVGSVRYYGDPKIAKSVRGVGQVERIAANP